MSKKYDAFISHASEDKDSFVRELADSLIHLGYRVWYDEFSMSVGDGLRRSIDRGILESRFGIVVLSNHFFSKGWANYELDGLVQTAVDNPGIILPIWHNVNRSKVAEYSRSLADIVAISTSGRSVVAISTELEKKLGEYKYVVHPDLTLSRSANKGAVSLGQRESGYQVLISLQTDQMLDKLRSNSRSEVTLYPYLKDFCEREFHFWQNEKGEIKLTRHLVYDVESESIISTGHAILQNDGCHLISKVKFTRQSTGPIRIVCDVTSTNQFKGLFADEYEFVEINHRSSIEHYRYSFIVPDQPDFAQIKAFSGDTPMLRSTIPGAICWTETIRPSMAGRVAKYNFVNARTTDAAKL
jgi:hypothetical protein